MALKPPITVAIPKNKDEILNKFITLSVSEYNLESLAGEKNKNIANAICSGDTSLYKISGQAGSGHSFISKCISGELNRVFVELNMEVFDNEELVLQDMIDDIRTLLESQKTKSFLFFISFVFYKTEECVQEKLIEFFQIEFSKMLKINIVTIVAI